MSALCRKRTSWHLLKRLGGGRDKRGRYGYTKCFCRPEVNDQFEFCRRLHRHVGRIFTLEDAIDVTCRAAVLLDDIGSIGDQAAAINEVSVEVDRTGILTALVRKLCAHPKHATILCFAQSSELVFLRLLWFD